MDDFATSRRGLLIAPLFASLSTMLLARPGLAAPDPAMTFTETPDQIRWTTAPGAAPNTVANADLWGDSSKPGLYYNLTKWYPGYMSAPHWYETDRLCVVVSGTWWVASGEKFDPEDTAPMPAGSFIRRVARTPHYDGVKKDGKEPAVIAICGIGPITRHAVGDGPAGVRKL
ncbi:MAG TPA: cupin domain-containing protein [Stellaceae bacterium]|jgi:hypothetical protein